MADRVEHSMCIPQLHGTGSVCAGVGSLLVGFLAVCLGVRSVSASYRLWTLFLMEWAFSGTPQARES